MTAYFVLQCAPERPPVAAKTLWIQLVTRNVKVVTNTGVRLYNRSSYGPLGCHKRHRVIDVWKNYWNDFENTDD